jgi:hypothetical protein
MVELLRTSQRWNRPVADTDGQRDVGNCDGTDWIKEAPSPGAWGIYHGRMRRVRVCPNLCADDANQRIDFHESRGFAKGVCNSGASVR